MVNKKRKLMVDIFIPFNTPSSKNSKQWTGKFLTASKNTHKWRKETKVFWEKYKEDFLKQIENLHKPIFIGMHFIRKSKHKFDFNNPTQTVQDEMVKYGWIEDDNTCIMYPLPFLKDNNYFTYDKDNPGVIIRILDFNNMSFQDFKDNFVIQ